MYVKISSREQKKMDKELIRLSSNLHENSLSSSLLVTGKMPGLLENVQFRCVLAYLTNLYNS
jgi:hypothetical protein